MTRVRMRTTRLEKAISELAAFLETNDNGFWAKQLLEIKDRLKDRSNLSTTRTELDSFFGGMGSLNDVAFGDEELNSEFGKLCDRVFRENRLVGAGFFTRLRWRAYELAQPADLPPRIRNGFAP